MPKPKSGYRLQAKLADHRRHTALARNLVAFAITISSCREFSIDQFGLRIRVWLSVLPERAVAERLPLNCLDSGAHLSQGQIGVVFPMELTGRAYTAVTASALAVGTAILISAILFCGS